MKYNKDLEFISSKINEENITAPETLSEDKISALLDGSHGERRVIQLKNRMTKAAKRAVAAAACFAVVIASFSGVYAYNTRVRTPSAVSSELVQYESYRDLKNRINQITLPDRLNSFNLLGGRSKVVYDTEYDAVAINEIVADGFGDESVSEAYAKTNKQVENVDEADKIKNDGRYIYFHSHSSDKVVIYSTDNGNATEVSSIQDGGYFREMFLCGDRLILISEDYGPTCCVAEIYNISDREHPELENKYSQSGSYISSRMIGNNVYIVSNSYQDNAIPEYGCSLEGDTQRVPIDNIYEIKDNESACFAVIGAFDIENGENASAKAVLGAEGKVYCNEKNLYLLGSNFDGNAYYTQIVKFTFEGTDIDLVASAKLDGTVKDQFSIDENNGYLRIATTTNAYGEFYEKRENNIFVLDEALEEVGKVTGLGKDESIKAVRYIGDTAYVITYVETDPLFVVDLSNPENPEITGEVKLNGFSTSLTPVDENTLLGIGYETHTNMYGNEATDGLKLVLFDITDKNNPRVLDEKVFNNVNSEAQFNHKAIVINREKGYFAIPTEQAYYGVVYGYSEDGYYNIYDSVSIGAIIIKTDENRLETYGIDTDSNITERVTYTGDYLYMLSANGISSAEVK